MVGFDTLAWPMEKSTPVRKHAAKQRSSIRSFQQLFRLRASDFGCILNPKTHEKRLRDYSVGLRS